MDHCIMFLLGFNVAASATIGVFFLQFWRGTRDRLFIALALAFWLYSAHWAATALYGGGEAAVVVYLLRLVAFAVIIAGIIDKNRTGSNREHKPPANGP
jgi:hypothetical protein